MQRYDVTGMSCAACSARVEKAVMKVDGVESCSVSLLTNSMNVSGGKTEDIIKAVENAGYGAALKGKNESRSDDTKPIIESTTAKLKKRLIASIAFLVLLMYVSMGHTMWNLPLPEALSKNPLGIGLVQLLLCIAVAVINRDFFINGFKGLLRRSPNMDTLVALGSFSAFAYSVYALFAMSECYVSGNAESAAHYLHELYFESSAMILALITVGKMLESRSKGKTTDALKSLLELAPKTARVIRDGEELVIPAAEVVKDDIFTVKPGDGIPVDGVVIEGQSAVNEAALTGESIPVDKSKGDTVSAATVNTSGFLKCRALRVGDETALAEIIRTVGEAAASKAPIAKVADKVSGIFVPTVMTIAAVTVAVWLLVGQSFGFALARGISVLVISCPCALGLATPVAIMVGSGVGAKNGILFKTAAALEETGRLETVVLDKTGTVTKGEPFVTGIYPSEGLSEEQLLVAAATAELRSEHPLAKAVMAEAEKRGLNVPEPDEFTALSGSGVKVKAENREIIAGNMRFSKQFGSIDGKVELTANKLSERGETPLIFVENGRFIGIISVADAVREDSREAVAELKKMGLEVVMLTGDNAQTAEAVGRSVGIDRIVSGVLPSGKEAVISELKSEKRVAMVGDGINDSVALTAADIGFAIGTGTDVAVDAADVVLMKSSLRDVAAAIRLGRATLRNIRENLFWAFIYNCIGIPLAAGAFISLLGWKMNPMFGAAAMSLSSFCVVTNALRLNFTDIYGKGKYKAKKEKRKMKKTIKVEGMMCMHCEAHVTKTLEAIDGVEKAVANHKKGTVEVKLTADVDDGVLKSAIEAAGYKVL